MINVHEAKTHFSKLLERVLAGEEITIARAGVPVARMVPIVGEAGKRKLGQDRDKIWVAEDFEAPLSAELIEEFER